MVLHKKLAKNGSVTIPQQLRHKIGLQPGVPLELEETKDGGVTIKKHVPSCRFCGNVEKVISYKDMELCMDCWEDIGRKYFCADKKAAQSAGEYASQGTLRHA